MTKIELIINALEDINAIDIVVFDMREKSPFFDYFVISSATSDRQLQAAITHINQDLSDNGFPSANVEGKNSKSWVLLDCKDIVVNVFTREEREFYNIEKMWAGIAQIDIGNAK